MNAATQLELVSYVAPVPTTATSARTCAEQQPWLSYQTVAYQLRFAHSRLVLFSQPATDATVAIAGRLLHTFFSASKGSDTCFQLSIISTPYTFQTVQQARSYPVTIPTAGGLMVNYHSTHGHGHALFVDRAGIDERRWSWYWAKPTRVLLASNAGH